MTLSRSFRLSPLVAGIIVAVLQTGVIGYMVESRAAILRNGADIRLKTSPVDPRDLLRGDYVILSYPISTISKSIVTGDIAPDGTRTRLSVRLKPDASGLWNATEARFADMAPEDGSVILRTLPIVFNTYGAGEMPDTLFVQYGLERYYVPEGEGRALENARNAEELEVEARVSHDGTPQIARLLLRGEPVYDEPLY
ncbi:GDYXXLXY domain-containing protein [Shinella sp. H4-D48]|uniref:GDYXXLXY domain-containing protein n=1 Tax=Shinella sp. H4-D48 TaxID=2925841 RepID=UPI001F52D5CE|nr:GDYXXLXY domain-containing protein [Shinella sp. H4-D48]UNK36756.1 GDYXXLXY domain-containing protein [Shinella sp. H4-D48]